MLQRTYLDRDLIPDSKEEEWAVRLQLSPDKVQPKTKKFYNKTWNYPFLTAISEILKILIFCGSVYTDTCLLIYVLLINVHTRTKLKPFKGPGSNPIREKKLPTNIGNYIREE